MKREPLDLDPRLKHTGIQAARFLSNLFSPMSSFAIFAFILAWIENSFWQGFIQGAIFGFWAALIPILFIGFQYKTGKITDIHISDRDQRHIPYLLGVIGAVITLLIYQWIDASPVLINLAIAVALTLVATGLINLRWLVSSHTTGAALIATFTGFVYGPQYWLYLAPYVVLVIFIRKYLRRHNYAELFGGVVLGAGVVCVMALVGRFI